MFIYYLEAACTDVLCKWNSDFVRKISGSEMKHVKFYKNSTELKKNPPAKRFMPATTSQQKCLLGMLNQIPERSKPVGLSLFVVHHFTTKPKYCRLQKYHHP